MSEMCGEKNPPSYISSPCIRRANKSPVDRHDRHQEEKSQQSSGRAAVSDGYEVIVWLHRLVGLSYLGWGPGPGMGPRAGGISEYSWFRRISLSMLTIMAAVSFTCEFSWFIFRNRSVLPGDVKSFVFEGVTIFSVASPCCLLFFNLLFYASRGKQFANSILALRGIKLNSYFWTAADDSAQYRWVWITLLMMFVRLLAQLCASGLYRGSHLFTTYWIALRIAMATINAAVDSSTAIQVLFFTSSFSRLLEKFNEELEKQLTICSSVGNIQRVPVSIMHSERFQRLVTCFIDIQTVFDSIKKVLAPAIMFKFAVELIVLVSTTYTAIVSLLRYSKGQTFPIIINQTLFYLIKSFTVLTLVSIWGSRVEERVSTALVIFQL